MAGQYGTNFATMQQAANDCRDMAGRLSGELGRLQSNVEHVKGAWRGDASNAFDGLMQRWNDDATKINHILMDIAETLEQAKMQYMNDDQAASETFSRINQQ